MKSPTTNGTNTPTQVQSHIAAFYCRVSTSDQEDQETITNQIVELKERIEQDGCLLSPQHEFKDDGWTGAIIERPALDTMRDAAAKDEFQALYVYDRGRLARDFVYQEVVIRELADRGIQFVTLHDPPAETPEQQVMQGMYGLFAQYERIKILERTRRGRIRKAKEGVLVSGQALYGYTRVAKTDDTPAHWIINEKEAHVVRMVFDWSGKKGLSNRTIRQKLYDLEIPTKKRKTKWWSTSTINRMLRNETYIKGIHYYNTSEAVPAKNPIKKGYKRVKNTSKKSRPKKDWIPLEVPVLLYRPGDEYLFRKAQRMLADNKKYARRLDRHDYLLSGFVYCECGKRRAGDGSNKYGHHYYRCVERVFTAPEKRVCASMGVNAEVVDGVIWQKLESLMTDPDLIRQQAMKWLKNRSRHSSANDNERTHLNDQVNKITEQEERYQRAYGEGAMDFEQLEKLMSECRNRKSGINKELRKLDQKPDTNSTLNAAYLDKVCTYAAETIEELDFGDKRATMRDLVDKVTIYGQKQAKICGHIPIINRKLESYDENRNHRAA
jgi:site-specific DNA recombinase